ncbi:hypothetical protein ElyMa_002558100 [Elysia marginata]|uniref:Uncharacterized protein n=1 Tax=Elysia marginata TaxID=1093978 RepID=A0AAV4GY19_9GAST|nr:hypothetical protein ElyMa_002558100 [Elysia marginata]
MEGLIFRYGPAPGDTADSEGRLCSGFTGFFFLQLQPDESVAIFGSVSASSVLMRLAAAAWSWVVEQGHGHMLIGACSGFEYVASPGAPSCGFTLSTKEDNGCSFAPKGYVPLYAIARARASADQLKNGEPEYVDLGIDYRGTRGPGDETIRPVVFNAPLLLGSSPHPPKL